MQPNTKPQSHFDPCERQVIDPATIQLLRELSKTDLRDSQPIPPEVIAAMRKVFKTRQLVTFLLRAAELMTSGFGTLGIEIKNHHPKHIKTEKSDEL